MIGYLIWKPGGWRIRYYEEELNGLRVLRAELPGTAHTSRGQRLQRKALEVLRRNGVNRVLNIGLSGVPPVATGPLWRAMAAPLALTELTTQGIPPADALVSLRAGKVDRSIVTCCTALATSVRGLSLEMPDCEGLTWALQRRFGIPIFQTGGDLALCFSGRATGIDLRGDCPQPAGFALDCAEVELPGDCPPEPMLAYLVEQGIVHLPEVKVVTKTPPTQMDQGEQDENT